MHYPLSIAQLPYHEKKRIQDSLGHREKTSRNTAHIWRRRQHGSWSLLDFIPHLYYWYIMANTTVGVGAGVLPAPSYQGSALAIGLLYKRELLPTLTPAQSQGPSLLLFYVCRSCSSSERESLNTCFQERITVHEFQAGDWSKAPNPWGQVKMYSFHRTFFIVYYQLLLTSGVSLLN